LSFKLFGKQQCEFQTIGYSNCLILNSIVTKLLVTVGDKTRNPGGVAGRLSGEKTGGLSGGKKIYFVYNGGNRKMRGGPNKIEKRGGIEKI